MSGSSKAVPDPLVQRTRTNPRAADSMDRARALAAGAVLLFGLSVSLAGDLDDLPKDNAGFREKIAAFIKPGRSVADARKILETHRFQCQDSKDTDGSFVWCRRSDAGPVAFVERRYQVVMRTDGPAVTSVKTSAGLVGP
jgi:hypothetical protein